MGGWRCRCCEGPQTGRRGGSELVSLLEEFRRAMHRRAAWPRGRAECSFGVAVGNCAHLGLPTAAWGLAQALWPGYSHHARLAWARRLVQGGAEVSSHTHLLLATLDTG